jgi:hypothetical protein
MFREECEKLAKIVHPNVVEIRDVGEIDEGGARKPYLVMPFLRGKTLDSLILDAPGGGLPLERARNSRTSGPRSSSHSRGRPDLPRYKAQQYIRARRRFRQADRLRRGPLCRKSSDRLLAKER